MYYHLFKLDSNQLEVQQQQQAQTDNSFTEQQAQKSEDNEKHKNFIYSFKIDLTIFENLTMLGLDPKKIYHQFNQIKNQLYLSQEQNKMFQFLSIGFKNQFIRKYQLSLKDRKNVDYLGNNQEQHYQYFIKGLKDEKNITLKLKQLFIYLQRRKNMSAKKQNNAQTEQSLNQNTKNPKYLISIFKKLQFFQLLSQISHKFQDRRWQKEQAYTSFYFLLSITAYLSLPIQQLSNPLYSQDNMTLKLNAIKQITLNCFEGVINNVKYGGWTQISEICFSILNACLIRQQNIQWIYSFDNHTQKSHLSVLKLLSKMLSPHKNRNVIVLQYAMDFIEAVRNRCQTMNQLLKFVIQSIGLKISNIISQIYETFKLELYNKKDLVQIVIPSQFILSQNFGRKPIRLQEKHISQVTFDKSYKNSYKLACQLKQKFEQFRNGKLTKRKIRKLSVKQQKQKIEQEINIINNFQHFQEKYEQSQLKQLGTYRSVGIIIKPNQDDFVKTNQDESIKTKVQKLVQDNQQLIRINQWYQNLLNQKNKIVKQLEEATAAFVDVKRNKKQLVFSKKTYDMKFEMKPSLEKQAVISSVSTIDKQSSQNVHSIKSIDGSNYILPPPPPPPSYLNVSPPMTPSPVGSTKNHQRGSRGSKQLIHTLPPPPPISLPPSLTLSPSPLPEYPYTLQNNKPAKRHSKQRKEMKTINWTTVQISKIKDSFWEDVNQIDLNQEQIIKFFSRKEIETIQPPVKTTKKQLKSILSGPRAKNIEIRLKKTKVQVQFIEKALANLDQNVLTNQTVQSLLNLVPTDKQIESFDEYSTVNLQEWAVADKYFLTITKISGYFQRLKAIKFKNQFNQMSQAYSTKIVQFIQFFQQLKEDKFLQQFFRYMLSVGNFLNENSNRGNAYGFRLQSIEKTYTLTSHQSSSSLFDYILGLMLKRNIVFPPISYYKSQFIAPIQVLREDLKQFSNMCKNVQQCLLLSDQEDTITSDFFLSFYISCREQISVMDQKFNIAFKIFRQVMQFYCQSISAQKAIKIINQFRRRVGSYLQKHKRTHRKAYY